MNQALSPVTNPVSLSTARQRAVRRLSFAFLIGLTSLTLAADQPPAKKLSAAESEALNSVAATALAMETYRAVQTAKIDAEFRKQVQATLKLSDPKLATDYIRIAAKRRNSDFQKLTDQLCDMQAAYYRSAKPDADTPAPRLDMKAAATRLRGIAASAPIADAAPLEKLVVRSILSVPEPKPRPLLRPMAETPNHPASLVESAASVAQLVELRYSSLALLAVAAFIVIERILHSDATTRRPVLLTFLPKH